MLCRGAKDIEADTTDVASVIATSSLEVITDIFQCCLSITCPKAGLFDSFVFIAIS